MKIQVTQSAVDTKFKYSKSSLSATSLSVVLTLVQFIMNSTKIQIVRNLQ